YFNISLITVMLRFYLMMAVVIGSLFAGVPWLCILALPIFLSIMLGVTFKQDAPQKTQHKKVKTQHKKAA
ncbi:MAG: hypothetical protein AAF705_17515, partial [Bacteroidota bacterium]